MDKKKVLILISTLFLLVLIITFSIIGIFNGNTTNSSKTKNDNHTNNSQIKGGTAYNHKDTQSEYEKAIEEAKEQEKLAKLQQKKEEQEKKAKEEKEEKKEKENENETTKVKENGVTYITNFSRIKIPEGVAGTAPVKSKRLPDSASYKNEKPFYDKYVREVPESTLHRKTQETKILHKYLRGNDLIITSMDVSTKGNRAAIAYKKKKGGIETALVSILNQAGTAKKEHLNNLHYTVNFDKDYIDKNITTCYKIVKELGMPIKENEFANLYKKYKYGKLTDNDYKKPYSIGLNEIEVVIEW